MVVLERNIIKAELMQRQEEGCNTADLSKRIQAAFEENLEDEEFIKLYNELTSLPVEDDFPYVEPDALDEIQALRPEATRKFDHNLNNEQLFDRIYGGWLGRAAGCALGKPVEGWPKERIDQFLADADVLPLDNYMPFIESALPKTHKPSTRGNIKYMDRDDDLDFPILGLLALEHRGQNLTGRTMANTWLHNMPFGKLYTAENAAYRNFTRSIWPPQSAQVHNPFREWIGAQIRADIFGYVAPGLPEKAAALAFQDASISHTKNGIYGEMFVAAMIAAAFVTDNVDDIIEAGLGEIPAKCRLAEAVKDTQAWCKEETEWEAVWQKIFDWYGKYHGVHTINNAALVVMGLYFGIDDFEQGIVCTVRAGWDADCTGATVGSILGVKFGAKALPDKWVGVLNDRLLSVVTGENDNKISDLATRTQNLVAIIAAPPEPVEESRHDFDKGGTWRLDTGWGEIELNFDKGTVAFDRDTMGPYDLTASAFQNPELSFSFSTDKGGWDFVVDFEGTINGDKMEGTFYPGEVPVNGKRIA